MLGGRKQRRAQEGFVVVFALLLSGLCALLAAQALQRARVDTRLAAHAMAADRADQLARGLLTALVDDLRARVARGDAVDERGLICLDDARCRTRYPALWELARQLPENVQSSVSLVEDNSMPVGVLPETIASAFGVYRQRNLEVRVELEGAAQAVFARGLALLQPASPDRESTR